VTDDWIEDPVLRLRMRLGREGDSLVGEVEFEPGGHIGRHFHPRQIEHWAVEEGELALRVGRRRLTLGAGEAATVPAGTRHSMRNLGTALTRARFTASPALDLGSFLTEAAAMNRAGRVTSLGLPKSVGALLDGAEYLERYRETCVLIFPPPFPPPTLQPLLFGPLGRWARRRGHGPGVDRTSREVAQ
jgi:quercetin dioxygenase-like cupin family protein